MSPEVVGILVIVLWLVIVFLRLPIGFGLLVAGVAGYWYLEGAGPTLAVLGRVPFRFVSSYTFTAIPAFILMGELAAFTGFGTDAYRAARAWVGHQRGGLGVATILGCTMIAAVVGSPIASAVTMSAISVPEMRKVGYDDRLTFGTVATGSILGPMIPPSTFFIIYSMLTEENLAYLFIAGIMPGLMLAALYIITILIWCKFNPKIAPVEAARASWKERLLATPHVWGIGLIFLFIIGGLYTGFFTPTEAGAMGAFIMLVLGLSRRRLSWSGFNQALLDSGRVVAMLFCIFAGVSVLNVFLAVSRLPVLLANFVAGFPGGNWGVMAAVLFMYFFLGFFMSILEIVIITVPIIYPLVVGTGFDGVWFGVLICLLTGIGTITPPYGGIVFALAGIFPEVSMWKIFKGCFPFVIANVIGLVLIVIFPSIALWLVQTMKPG